MPKLARIQKDIDVLKLGECKGIRSFATTFHRGSHDQHWATSVESRHIEFQLRAALI